MLLEKSVEMVVMKEMALDELVKKKMLEPLVISKNQGKSKSNK